MACDTNQLMNDARCWDACIPPGMMDAVLIGCLTQDQPFIPPTQPGIRGEGMNEFILDEGGFHILPES